MGPKEYLKETAEADDRVTVAAALAPRGEAILALAFRMVPDVARDSMVRRIDEGLSSGKAFARAAADAVERMLSVGVGRG